jgi:hypothetical protein
MTTINPFLLVLLDLENEYEKFERIFNPQLLCRFNNKIQCLTYISSRLTNIRLLHFFIPKSEYIEIIGDNINFFNTIYYIYCMNQESINQMKEQYNLPMFFKIFHVDSLSTYLRQAAIAHLIEQAERAKHEPDEYDIALQEASELSDALANELYKHMINKTGVLPDD